MSLSCVLLTLTKRHWSYPTTLSMEKDAPSAPAVSVVVFASVQLALSGQASPASGVAKAYWIVVESIGCDAGADDSHLTVQRYPPAATVLAEADVIFAWYGKA